MWATWVNAGEVMGTSQLWMAPTCGLHRHLVMVGDRKSAFADDAVHQRHRGSGTAGALPRKSCSEVLPVTGSSLVQRDGTAGVTGDSDTEVSQLVRRPRHAADGTTEVPFKCGSRAGRPQCHSPWAGFAESNVLKS
jgi:hypothetical protein